MESMAPTNLRRFRKKKQREARERQASANRAHNGLDKGERARLALEARRRERVLDGARRTPGEPE